MICNKPCNNKNEFNYCKTTTCIHPEMWSFIISPEKCLENSKLDNLNKGIDELITEYYKLKIVNDELREELFELEEKLQELGGNNEYRE